MFNAYPRLTTRMPGLRAHSSLGSHVTQTAPSGGDELVFHAATYAPDTFELTQELIGEGGQTFVHTADILRKDHEGTYRTFGENEPVWEGGRVVENEVVNSDDLTQGYVTNLGSTIDDFETCTLPKTRFSSIRRIIPPGEFVLGDLVRICDDIQHVSGDLTGAVISFGTTAINITDKLVTGEWVRFSSTPNGITGIGLVNVIERRDTALNDILVFKVRRIVVENHRGASVAPPPGDYFPVTTGPETKTFANANGNSVTSNVVTEAVGAPLPEAPWLVYQPAATQLQIQSNDQTDVEWATTNVTVAQDAAGIDGVANSACTLTATAANGTVIANAHTIASATQTVKWYIKRKTGAGDIDLTLDNGATWTTIAIDDEFDGYVVDQAALANPQIGIRIVTDADAVIVGNAEFYAGKTAAKVRGLGPIFTTTTAAATDETIITHAAANHDNTEGTYSGAIDYAGDDADVLSLGGVPFLYIEDAPVSGKQLTLSDGTNQVSEAITAGEHEFEAHYNAADGEMQLTLDAATSAVTVYDGTLGTGDLTVGETGRDFKRFDTSGIV